MSPPVNLLVIMADQLAGTLFPDGPLAGLHTPNLARLAERSARFAACYTPSPLCVPARAAFMSGQLPSRSGVFDNAAEFPASVPTFAHYLRRAGYYTALSGKMHFVGPDQLHGFETRLTTDIYPADFGWTPDYRRPGERIDWWYHNMGSVTGAGVGEFSNQLEFDDEVAFHGEAELRRLARGNDPRPWCLAVSFTHPHDPYVARRADYDRYADSPLLEPRVAAFEHHQHDPHSQRLLAANDHARYEITGEHVRRARRAYLANVSYVDAQAGRLLDLLDACGLADNTVVVFTADHGDMLGERGLWFKMSFFEGSARVPLMIAGPGIAPTLHHAPVSTLDLARTLAGLAGADEAAFDAFSDGVSLLGLLHGDRHEADVRMEYAAEGSHAPLVSIRRGRYKYNHCELDPPQLFDLDDDPDELHNLAGDDAHAERLADFVQRRQQYWDMDRLDAAVRDSQARRRLVYQALRQGRHQPWDFNPDPRSHDRYMRNHMDLNVVEQRARFPKAE